MLAACLPGLATRLPQYCPGRRIIRRRAAGALQLRGEVPAGQVWIDDPVPCPNWVTRRKARLLSMFHGSFDRRRSGQGGDVFAANSLRKRPETWPSGQIPRTSRSRRLPQDFTATLASQIKKRPSWRWSDSCRVLNGDNLFSYVRYALGLWKCCCS